MKQLKEEEVDFNQVNADWSKFTKITNDIYDKYHGNNLICQLYKAIKKAIIKKEICKFVAIEETTDLAFLIRKTNQWKDFGCLITKLNELIKENL